MRKYTFYYDLFIPLDFFFSRSSSIKNEYAFDLRAHNSFTPLPPNSSLKKNWCFFILTYWKRSFIIFIIIKCIKPSFNIIRNIFIKIFSYNMRHKAISIRVTCFALSSYFGLIQSCQNSYIRVLLISNIDMPRYTGLFIVAFIFFISIANKFSEKCFVV